MDMEPDRAYQQHYQHRHHSYDDPVPGMMMMDAAAVPTPVPVFVDRSMCSVHR